jgi:Protein of unknown function (DUF4238)
MSVPRKHHYLPKFYLDRWAMSGQVFRYVRPLGPAGKLHYQKDFTAAVAYKCDLYHQPDIHDPVASQSLESRFFQQIDDRAAVALQKLDQSKQGSLADRIALSQFMISLLHRSPSRLDAIRSDLAERTEGAPYDGLEGDDFDNVVKSTANRLLAALIESPESASIISKFRAFKIEVKGASKTLLTSDRPITVSAQLIAQDAFMILPYAPDRLVILTHIEAIAEAFSSQNPNALVEGINQAVVEQSEDIVIACDNRATRMIDRLFLRPQPGRVLDSIGLIRRKSPMIDFTRKTPNFSRHDKNEMKGSSSLSKP